MTNKREGRKEKREIERKSERGGVVGGVTETKRGRRGREVKGERDIKRG